MSATQRECPVCRTTVPPGLHGIRLECSHWVHTKCLDKKDPDFEQCASCKGDVDLNVPMVDANEPSCIDGRDYVQQPLASESYFSSLRAQRSDPVFAWLAERKPVEWMIRNQGYGLQRMLKTGVKMDDFLKNGYTWQDLRTFKDLSLDAPSKERARQALYALKTNAEHFRDYPHLLGSVIPDLQINGRHLVELYGLYFPSETEPLVVVNGNNEKYWSAAQLVTLGMRAQDLFGAGMETLDQYAHLQPTDQDERALGMTNADVNALKTVQEEEEVVVKQPQGRRVIIIEEEQAQPVIRIPVVPKPKMKRVHGLKPKKR